MSKFGLTISEERVRSLSSNDAHVTKQGIMVLSVETFDFLVLTHFCDKNPKRQIQAWAKTSRQEVRTKDERYESMVEEYPKSYRTERIMKFLGIKLLGHYQYYGMSGNFRLLPELLRSCRETCL